MIQSVEIINIQSHRKTKLEFSDGLNIITGTSDSGKTAILRSLRLAINNKPSGQAYCSRWMKKGDTSKVVVTTMEGDEITRQEKPEKLYKLNDTEFKAFGTEVPEEIKAVFNFGEVNDQAQMNMPFLINVSAGEVASHFNKVARLDKIDTATANVNSWIRELTADIKYKTNQQKELEEKAEKFKYLDKFEIEVEVLEGMEKRKLNLYQKEQKLELLIIELQVSEKRIEKASEILSIEKPLNTILYNIQQRDRLNENRSKFRRLVAQIKDTELELEENKKVLLIEPLLTKIFKRKENLVKQLLDENVLKGLVYTLISNQKRIDKQNNIIAMEKPVKDLLALFEIKNTRLLAIAGLNKAVLALNNTFTLIAKNKAEFALVSAEFDSAMGDVCILCGSKLKK